MANRRKTAQNRKKKGAPERSRSAPRARSASRISRDLTPNRPKRNRRLPQPKKAPAVPKAKSRTQSVHHEAIAVMLWCAGLLTLLSLISFDAADASLNASGSVEAENWIGPAGAYWADLLLQGLGIGAFVLGTGLLLAGWRAFVGKRILPTFREGAGSVLLVICLGSFAHQLLLSTNITYPAGGVAGAILGQLLRQQFALAGGFILAGALVLLSLAVTADGILAGLGLKGLGILRELGNRLHATWVIYRERRERLREHREKITSLSEMERADHWTFGELQPLKPIGPTTKERAARIERAKERGQKLGDAAAEKEERQKRQKAAHDQSEPCIQIDESIDIPAEERFELGETPNLESTPGRALPPPIPADASSEELCPDDVELDVPIRAAIPDKAAESPKAPAAARKEPEAPVVPAQPKRTLLRHRKTGAEPEIVDVRPEVDAEKIERAAEEAAKEAKKSQDRKFELPSPKLLDIQVAPRTPLDQAHLRQNAQQLIKTLKDYGIEGEIRRIQPGPVITMYEFVPAPGIKISKIANLADDLAMSMKALRVRIVAPIPGKGAVGIEIPNREVETVFLKELITHEVYRRTKAKLPLALGKNIEGAPRIADLARMPHLLVAGATGSGKSVSVNAMIMSLIFKATPEDIRLIMVDPKRLELSVYDGIPHLLLPVVTDPKKASLALRWAVDEMDRRYHLLSGLAVRNLDGYNQKVRAAQIRGETLSVKIKNKAGQEQEETCERLPYIVVIVDELADLMMVASREVEASIMRLAQMARAAGIHLILATQRPSVDVLTGVIKANFPTRIAFQVASKHDSRTILDMIGAEHLLGRGDLLFLAPGTQGVSRVHGSFVSDEEIERTVSHLKEQGEPDYDESILAQRDDSGAAEPEEDEGDEMYDQAVAIVAETRQASISMIQRRLRIGYNRAARLVERMEREGIVGLGDGAKPREVLIPSLPE